MKDRDKTKEQLIQELAQLRQRVDELESPGAQPETAALYQQLVQSSVDWVWIVDLDGNTTFTNPAIESFLGYQPAEILGASSYLFIHPDDQEPVRQLMEQSIAQKTGWSKIAIRWRHKDGTIRYSESSGQPIVDPEGKLTGFSGIDRDITQRKQLEDELAQYRDQLEQLVETRTAELQSVISRHQQTEMALRESEEKYRALYAAMNEGAGLYELIYAPSGKPEDYRVLDINPAYETLTGLNRDEVVGRRALEIFAGARPRYLEVYAQVVASGEPASFETYFAPWDKYFSVSVFSPATGKFASTFYDITERRRAEEALRRYTERLKILHEVDQAILKAQSPQATAEAALRYLRQLIPCQRITVGLYDAFAQERVMLASAMNGEVLMGEGYRHVLDPVWVERIQHGDLILIHDLALERDPLPSFAGLVKQGFRSLLSVPLSVQDELIGSLNVMADQPHAFTDDHVEIAVQVAAQLAIAIRQARLREQVEHHVAQLEALRQVTLDITAQLELDDLLAAVVKSAVTLLGVQGGGIALYRPDRDVLEWVVGSNMDDIPTGLEMSRGEGISGQVWEQGKSVAVDNYAEWEHYKAGRGSAAIGAPIQWGGDFLGTIAVAHVGSAARTFSERDSQLLELLAHQAAIAIQNVRLYEEVQRHASTLEDRVVARTLELAEAKQQTDTILQNIGDAVVFTDIGANILYANPAWETLTGYTLREVTGQNLSILKSGNTALQTYQAMWSSILGGNTWRGVLQNKRQDGACYDSELTIAPVKDERGQIDHFVGVMRDVTEQRQLAAMKERFIADAAHDLGNPVAVLQTSLYLLKKDPSQLDRRLARFEHEINRLTALVKDLLAISSLDRKAVDVRLEEQDLNAIVRQVVESQSSLAIARKLTLAFDAEQNLPGLMLDDKQMERVVVNLVANALNYTTEGGQVRVSTRHDGDRVVLTVNDTGIGIASNDLRQIFERFYRADRAKITADGTGLGLSIVKEIVDLHGGQIEVESEDGQGSTFKVLLPTLR